MNKRTKLGLVGILALGCVASGAIIIRIPYLQDYKDHDFLCEFGRFLRMAAEYACASEKG